MKKTFLNLIKIIVFMSLCLFIVSCQNQTNNNQNENNNSNTEENQNQENNNSNDSRNVLIAYFSCTGTTKRVAETLASEIDGSTLFEIVAEIPYTGADLNYNDRNSRSTIEQNDDTVRPEISNIVDDIADYDVIFIGYPIWWGQAPKIIYTFVESYDLDGVMLIPFCTSGGSSMGSSGTNLHASAPNANWKQGARIRGNDVSSLISQMN